MIHSVHAVLHLPYITVLWTAFLAFLRAILTFGIRRSKNPAQQLHRRNCEFLTPNYVSSNVIYDDMREPQRSFRGRRCPLIIRSMVSTDISCNNVSAVAGKPVSIVGFEKDVVHVQYLKEPSDILLKPCTPATCIYLL